LYIFTLQVRKSKVFSFEFWSNLINFVGNVLQKIACIYMYVCAVQRYNIPTLSVVMIFLPEGILPLIGAIRYVNMKCCYALMSIFECLWFIEMISKFDYFEENIQAGLVMLFMAHGCFILAFFLTALGLSVPSITTQSTCNTRGARFSVFDVHMEKSKLGDKVPENEVNEVDTHTGRTDLGVGSIMHWKAMLDE